MVSCFFVCLVILHCMLGPCLQLSQLLEGKPGLPWGVGSPPVPPVTSPLLVLRCCLLSIRSSSKEEEPECGSRVRNGPSLPAASPLCQCPSSPSTWHEAPESAFLWLPLESVLASPSRRWALLGQWSAVCHPQTRKPRMLGSVVWLLAALSGCALNSQKDHQDWGLVTYARVFPKDTGAAALGSPRAITVPVVTLTRRGLHPATGITSGKSGDNLWLLKSGELGAKLADFAWEFRRKGRDSSLKPRMGA